MLTDCTLHTDFCPMMSRGTTTASVFMSKWKRERKKAVLKKKEKSFLQIDKPRRKFNLACFLPNLTNTHTRARGWLFLFKRWTFICVFFCRSNCANVLSFSYSSGRVFVSLFAEKTKMTAKRKQNVEKNLFAFRQGENKFKTCITKCKDDVGRLVCWLYENTDQFCERINEVSFSSSLVKSLLRLLPRRRLLSSSYVLEFKGLFEKSPKRFKKRNLLNGQADESSSEMSAFWHDKKMIRPELIHSTEKEARQVGADDDQAMNKWKKSLPKKRKTAQTKVQDLDIGVAEAEESKKRTLTISWQVKRPRDDQQRMDRLGSQTCGSQQSDEDVSKKKNKFFKSA